MQPNELATAKINAALKILEWSRDDIEPGIGGMPDRAHVAFAEAFKDVYRIIGEAIDGKPEARERNQAVEMPIGDERQGN